MTSVMSRFKYVVIIILFFFINSNALQNNKGRIKGSVTEANTNDPLIGANVLIDGTSLGSATDIDGFYMINNIPYGAYTLKVTYLGYQLQEHKVIINSGKILELNFSLQPELLEGEEVFVTAQREGQMAAINQQITSNAIKNIVASDKIEELPEANAAEAVGRLPGVSLQREGGEGNKVVIRGLAPKYNKIQIDGVNMASTSSDDRSSDLSMISPYMLGGIEVTKTAMADQEADQLGGIVNFVLKGAPYKKPSYRFIMEGGYNELKDEYDDYKFVAQHSRRLFSNQLGFSVNLDLEQRNRSSNTVSAGYKYLEEDRTTVVNSLNINDVTRKLNRYNGSIFLDFQTGTTDIKLSSMFSRINRDVVSRGEISADLHGASNRSQSLTFTESNSTIIMNKLKIEQIFSEVKFDLGISYSYSLSKTPEELSYGGREASPLTGAIPYSAKPVDIPNFMKNDISLILLGSMDDADSKTFEDELGSYFNVEWETNVFDLFNLKLKAGGKYKHKIKEYNYNNIYLDLGRDPSNLVNSTILEKYPWMGEYLVTNSFPYQPFIDNSYDPGNFMDGQYLLERIPSLNLGKELIHHLHDELGILWQGDSTPQKFVPDFHASKRYDYNGYEDYYAAYILPELNFGDSFTLIPGFRYELNKTVYTGVRGDGSKVRSVGYVHHENEVERENDFFLPMIHARYKPFDWFDIRVSYTNTLSRPSYTEFLPSWHITSIPLSVDYRNPELKPSKSENYDLYFSFYGNEIGLFTLGYFYKSIDDLIFSQNQIIISEEMAVNEFSLTEEETGLSPASFVRKPIWSFVNNPNESKVWGIEVEWQSNLWFLPGLLNNVVFGINYTYTQSEVLYPRTVPIYDYEDSPFGRRKVIVGNEDSPYSAPLLYQPDHILNITLGYDYEGFSIRGSMQFKSDIFSTVEWRPEERGYTNDFYLYDLAVSQKLPIEGLSLFGNLKNISKTIETDINNGTGFMSNKEYYGMSANFGVKYTF